MENISLSMIRADLNHIPEYALPDGYSIRLFRPDDPLNWIEIVRSGEHYINIGDDMFEKEFAQDMPSVQTGMYFLVEPGGKEIGTSTIWPAPNLKSDGLDYGRLHWVAIRPEFQGRGLCKPLLAFVLRHMAQRYNRSVLGTSSRRTVALKCYLDFDYVPDMTFPRAQEGWSQVKSVMSHPVLASLTV